MTEVTDTAVGRCPAYPDNAKDVPLRYGMPMHPNSFTVSKSV